MLLRCFWTDFNNFKQLNLQNNLNRNWKMFDIWIEENVLKMLRYFIINMWLSVLFHWVITWFSWSLSFHFIKNTQRRQNHQLEWFLPPCLWAAVSYRFNSMRLLRGDNCTKRAVMQTLWLVSVPVVGNETYRWGKERRGGCENFLKWFAVLLFRTWWSSLVEMGKLLFCNSSEKKSPSAHLNWN